MNKLSKILLTLLVLSLVTVICLSIYCSVNNLPKLKSQNQGLKAALSEELLISSFHQGILKTEVEALRNTIINSEANTYSIETYQLAVDYCITYIVLVQKIMDLNEVVYPEFIIKDSGELELK